MCASLVYQNCAFFLFVSFRPFSSLSVLCLLFFTPHHPAVRMCIPFFFVRSSYTCLPPPLASSLPLPPPVQALFSFFFFNPLFLSPACMLNTIADNTGLGMQDIKYS